MRVVGLMSGTSYDGIDVAVADLELVGDEIVLTPIQDRQVPYEKAITERIASLLPPARTTIAEVCQLDALLGRAYAEAAAGHAADLVVSHGQTVFHWVDDGQVNGTLQLGQPAWIAQKTGAPVISDLRSADIAAGGQGAPLVPAFDALLLGRDKPRAALNLGGIANVTVIKDEKVIGYDTGPANALIDLAARRFFGIAYDRDGRHAASGHVDERLLERLLADPYYRRQPPKSTGKELFHVGYLDKHLENESAEDVLATLTELTARTVAGELNRHGVTEVLASGGGVRNPALMRGLKRHTTATVGTIDELGIPSDAKEAYAFAVLGFLSWYGLPAAIPSVTGASTARILGSYTPGAGPLRLPEPHAGSPTRMRVR